MREFIETTIREAGKAIMSYFGHAEVAYTKKDMHDVVTHADLASNKIIVTAIRSTYPDHAVISEEEKDTSSSEQYKWYIDPLDGTKNFSTHVPLFGINIALAKDGVVTHAAIYLPFFDELVYAEQGKGAWLNGTKLAQIVSKDLVQTYGLMGANQGKTTLEIASKLVQLSGGKLWINRLGSQAISGVYLATARRDWQITFGGGSWDYAAAACILKEVGYTVTDISGEEWKPGGKGIVVASPHLHAQLIEVVKNHLA